MVACEAYRDRLLDPEDLDAAAHLQTCGACAAEAASLGGALAAVTLRPAAADAATLAGLPARVLSEARRAQSSHSAWQRAATVALVAAAAAVMILVPPALKKGRTLPGAVAAPVEASVEGDGAVDPVEATGIAFADEDGSEWSDDDAVSVDDEGAEP
jgi:anti-sigma factor RsiW